MYYYKQSTLSIAPLPHKIYYISKK